MKALIQVESIKLSRSLGVFLLSIGMPVIFFLIFSSPSAISLARRFLSTASLQLGVVLQPVPTLAPKSETQL